MVTCFKDKINPFVILVHCVTHKTNFATLDAMKALNYKKLSKNLDIIINVVVGYLEKSSKCKNALQRVQMELNDT